MKLRGLIIVVMLIVGLLCAGRKIITWQLETTAVAAVKQQEHRKTVTLAVQEREGTEDLLVRAGWDLSELHPRTRYALKEEVRKLNKKRMGYCWDINEGAIIPLPAKD